MVTGVEAGRQLTDDHQTVYDRQLRVWGHEVQKRLTEASVLIIGGDGLAAEVAKNLVLAGIGNVTLVDDTPSSQVPFGNFLVAPDAQQPTVAAASAATLSAMNPLISCRTTSLGGLHCSAQQPVDMRHLQPEQLAAYDLVLSCCGLSRPAADRLEQLCADAGKMLYIAQASGSSAYAFVHLGSEHLYRDKKKPADTTEPPSKVLTFPRLTTALSRPVGQCLGRRPIHPLYQVLRAARKFEETHDRPPAGPQDLTALQVIIDSMEQAEGVPPGSVPRAWVEGWLADLAGDSLATAATCAVTGGVLANSIMRSVSRVGAPIKNWFFFSVRDNVGAQEDINGPDPA